MDEIEDLSKIKRWARETAYELLRIGKGDPKRIERLLLDLRAASLPQDFANTLVNNAILLRREGVNIPSIPDELQYFPSVSKFKEVKSIVMAELFNVQVHSETWWLQILKMRSEGKSIEEIAGKFGVDKSYISKVITIMSGESK